MTGRPKRTEEAIESDEGRERDRIRDLYMIKLGYKMLRVQGYEVSRDDGNAHERIWQFVADGLSAQGGGDA